MSAERVPGNVVALHSTTCECWTTVSVRVAPPRPSITPGPYWGRSVAAKTYKAFDRTILELGFDIFDGNPGDGAVLARLPMFIRLPPAGAKLSPNSRLASMLYMLGQVRGERVTSQNLDILRFKLWRVEVGDTKQDHTGSIKDSEIQSYSVVRRVLARG